MHLQGRSSTKASPPDLAKFLGVLAAAGINIQAIGGGGLELEGEVYFAVDDERAIGVLEDSGYHARWLRHDAHEFDLVEVEDRPGGLRDAIGGIVSSNLSDGKVIADILVGKDTDGVLKAQVRSVEVKTQSHS